jgi:hypothetical protein
MFFEVLSRPLMELAAGWLTWPPATESSFAICPGPRRAGHGQGPPGSAGDNGPHIDPSG